jgi:hypothetical protein
MWSSTNVLDHIQCLSVQHEEGSAPQYTPCVFVYVRVCESLCVEHISCKSVYVTPKV